MIADGDVAAAERGRLRIGGALHVQPRRGECHQLPEVRTRKCQPLFPVRHSVYLPA